MSPLPLGPLFFYPLSLEAATFDATGALTSFDVVGRLHLPTMPGQVGPEPTNRSNAVKLTFNAGKLAGVALAALDPDDDATGPVDAPVGEWPLADLADAPLLHWSAIKLAADAKSVVLTVQLMYMAHFGVSWTLPAKPLTIAFSGPVPVVTYTAGDFRSAPDAAVSITGATLELDFSNDPTRPTGPSRRGDLAVRLGPAAAASPRGDVCRAGARPDPGEDASDPAALPSP